MLTFPSSLPSGQSAGLIIESSESCAPPSPSDDPPHRCHQLWQLQLNQHLFASLHNQHHLMLRRCFI